MPLPPPSNSDSSREERYSAEFDGEFASHHGDRVTPEEAVRFQREWSEIQESLRNLPVNPATGLMQQVHREMEITSRTAWNVASPAVPNTRFRQQTRALVVASSLAMTLLVASSVFRTVPDRGTASQLVAAAVQPVEEAELSLLEWQVVVVTVDQDSQAAAYDAINSTLSRQSGKPLISPDLSEYPLGIAVMSADESRQLINNVSHVTHTEEIWNPQGASDLSHEELMARFFRSLKTPTRSEEIFGEVRVLGPVPESLNIVDVQDVERGTQRTIRESLPGDASKPPETVDASSLDAGDLPPPLKPVLVVLRTRVPADVAPSKVEKPDHTRLVPFHPKSLHTI